jgi:hydroxymethylpyrimidine pyrophosphatase-like HAD family hydrolase
MFFLALAADYDGTIAHHGAVDEKTCNALRRLKQTGRRLLLVTGRELAEIKHAFPELDLFDTVIAENGAVIYNPTTDDTTLLAPPPVPELVGKLMARKVEPLSVGHCILATWEPHQTAVLEAIQELGLELKIVFNKGAVMVLPAAISKASGLEAALSRLDISPHNVIGVGDAENDHAFLRACGCAAAVANALPGLMDEADVKLSGDHGEGVIQLIQDLIKDESRLMPAARLGLPIGIDRTENEVCLMPHQNVLVVGDSCCGKSKFAKMLTEKMGDKGFTFCVIDPEGDYQSLQHSVVIAEPSTAPRSEEALAVLRQTGANVVVNIVALDPPSRKQLVSKLLGPISDLNARTGRPHWLIVDEAHQIFPAEAGSGPILPATLPASIFITVAPENVSDEVLKRIDVVIAFGRGAGERLARVGKVIGFAAPLQGTNVRDDEVVAWFRDDAARTLTVKIDAPRQVHRRHSGKYAVGNVGEEHSFYFRGTGNKTIGCARNVGEFVHLCSHVDDPTWEFHLRRNDYSAWFRNIIRDEVLAEEIKKTEDDRQLTPRDSRAKICRMVMSRFAAPVS